MVSQMRLLDVAGAQIVCGLKRHRISGDKGWRKYLKDDVVLSVVCRDSATLVSTRKIDVGVN